MEQWVGPVQAPAAGDHGGHEGGAEDQDGGQSEERPDQH